MSLLPSKPIPMVFDPQGMWILLYGRAKIGKSTWAASFPKAIFACSEEGHGALEVMRVTIDSWKSKTKPNKDEHDVMHMSWHQFCDELEHLKRDDELKYRTIIIDTSDRLYRICFDYVCESEGIEHPSDQKYGKGWDRVGNEFRQGILRLRKLRLGALFISHTNTRYVSVGDTEVEKKELSLPGKAQQVIVPEVDLILRADYATNEQTGENQRVLVAEGTSHSEGGSRWSLPPLFPLTKSGGYGKLLGYLKGQAVPEEMKQIKIGNIKPKRKLIL